MSWVVVKFIASEEVEVLPALWYNAEKQICLYPSYTRQKLEKAIKSLEKPESHWKQYPVKLLSSRTYESFKIATAKASKACFTSDLSDSVPEQEVLPEKRISKKIIYSSDEEESDESLLDIPVAPIPRPSQTFSVAKTCLSGAKSTRNKTKSATEENLEKCVNEEGAQSTKYDSDDAFKKIIITQHVKQCKMIKELENGLNEVRMSLGENKDILKELLNMSNKSPSNVLLDAKVDIFNKLPIKTLEEVDTIENDLLNNDNFTLLVKSFTRLGGTDYKELIRRILTRMMNDEIMKLYSLHGHKGKKVFAKTKLFSALTEAVKVYDTNVTIKEIELKTGMNLAKAPERIKSREKHDLDTVENV